MNLKIKNYLIFCFILITCAILLTACDYDTANSKGDNNVHSPNDHIHEFGDEWIETKAATCSENGVKERYCWCGEAQIIEIEKTAHTEIIDMAVPSTCLTTGLSEGVHCEICNEILIVQEEMPLGEHTEITDKAVSPTCQATGLTEGKHCSVCNTVLVEQQTLDTITCNIVIDKAIAATCTSTGLTEGKSCSMCNKIFVEQKTVSKLSHTWVTDKAIAATCSSTGLTEGSHCKNCNTVKVKQNTISKLPHTTVKTSAVAPTCTQSGLTEGSRCSSCKTTITAQKTVPALGHNFDVMKNACTKCFEKELPEITSRNDSLASNANDNRAIYLDKVVTVSNTTEYWTCTLKPDCTHIRLIGTPGVVYNFRIVVEAGRTKPAKIDLVNVALTAGSGNPVIKINCTQEVEIGFYGTECKLLAPDGAKGQNGGITTNFSMNGDPGKDGSDAIQSAGNVKLIVAANSVEIKGGNGGNGGKGKDASPAPQSGGDGGNGGNGGYAISANSIDIYGQNGYSSRSITLTGGNGGTGGSGGKKFLIGSNGKKGADGKSSSATSISATYH